MTKYAMSGGGILMPEAINLTVGGRFEAQLVRQGEVIDEFGFDNLVVNEGLDALLNIMFHGTTQIATWYCGLFEGNYTPVSTLTAATITAAATETTTGYSETTRQEFNEAASSGQSITNSANKATFTFTGTKSIYGAFLASASAKGATSGTLFSAARFGSAKSVVTDDQLLLTYTIGAASA